MTLTILADDLTGACDTGSLFARHAPVPVTVWPRPIVAAAVRVIDTESRALPAAEAAARVRGAAGAGGGRWFKKVDSTLRGRIGAEVEALVEHVGAPSALVCPAFPAQGRTVRGRELFVDGRAVETTPVAADPTFPSPPAGRAGAASSVVELLRPQLTSPVAWIPLDQVRAGARGLAERIARLAGMVVIADAETDEDLATLVDAVLDQPVTPLLVGAAGLAHALARRLGLLGAPPALPRARRWLVVVGSRHPAARRQADAARRAGGTVLTTPERLAGAPGEAAASVARQAREALEADAFDIVAVTGGDTAVALFEALHGERIDLAGAPEDGLALGWLRAPRYPALPLLTKAGAFGAPDIFARLMKQAAA